MVTRALVVGIERYKDARNNLDGVSNDLIAINNILNTFDIQKEHIEMLRDEQATCANIKAKLHQLTEGTTDEDVRIFYFSGHGLVVPASVTGTGPCEALVPHDGSHANLLMDQWMADFLLTQGKHCSFWAIYDACHSGEMYKDFDEQNKVLHFDRLEDDSERHVPAFRNLNPDKKTKALVLDGTISKAVHIAAVDVKQKAIVRSIDGVRRSIFTWALEHVAVPAVEVQDLEAKIVAKQKSIVDDLEAQVAANPAHSKAALFSRLM
jgi:hypothetical protein